MWIQHWLYSVFKVYVESIIVDCEFKKKSYLKKIVYLIKRLHLQPLWGPVIVQTGQQRGKQQVEYLK